MKLMCVASIMFSLIRSEICDTALEKSVKDKLSIEVFKELFALSNTHDVAHIVASALSKAELLGEDDISIAFKNVLMRAVYRDAQREYVIQQIIQVFEKNKILHIPLKGMVLRNYYPHTWLRTSCDVDVLISETDLENATLILTTQYEYTNCGKGTHDVSLFSKTKNHVELHFDLVEENTANSASMVLQNVMDTASKHKDYEYWLDMSDEMFYFYHIAHMAKHFEFGGCGVRSFLDLWMLNHNIHYDKDKRDHLLSEGNLITFEKQAVLLSEIWFGDAEHTEITQQMQDYILLGGVYGTSENRIAVQQQKRGGKLQYALTKIFLSYDKLKYHYPLLEKHKWLTPFMEVRRWFKLIFCGHAKRTLNELKYNQTISADRAAATKKLLDNIGL